MHNAIEHEMLGMILSYAGIALDQPNLHLSPSEIASLQENLEHYNMQLYTTGKVTLEGAQAKEALFRLLRITETYLQGRYTTCLESEGPESGYAKQLREDIGLVDAFRNFIENIDKRPEPEAPAVTALEDAPLMSAIVSALSRPPGTGKDALINDTLKEEMEALLLKLVRQRLA